ARATEPEGKRRATLAIERPAQESRAVDADQHAQLPDDAGLQAPADNACPQDGEQDVHRLEPLQDLHVPRTPLLFVVAYERPRTCAPKRFCRAASTRACAVLTSSSSSVWSEARYRSEYARLWRPAGSAPPSNTSKSSTCSNRLPAASRIAASMFACGIDESMKNEMSRSAGGNREGVSTLASGCRICRSSSKSSSATNTGMFPRSKRSPTVGWS